MKNKVLTFQLILISLLIISCQSKSKNADANKQEKPNEVNSFPISSYFLLPTSTTGQIINHT